MICVDLLHGVHKMVRDHIVPWLEHLVGTEELDRRLMAQPRHVGERNFARGISHISQWTGKESRDLERHILPVIAGAEGVPTRAVLATRVILEISYMAQFPTHTETALQAMDAQLAAFWDNVQIFIDRLDAARMA
jgi:hypothetical protein